MLSAVYCNNYNLETSNQARFNLEIKVAALAQRFLINGLDQAIANTIAQCIPDFQREALMKSFSKIGPVFDNFNNEDAKQAVASALNDRIEMLMKDKEIVSIVEDHPRLAAKLLQTQADSLKWPCPRCGSFIRTLVEQQRKQYSRVMCCEAPHCKQHYKIVDVS